MRGLARHRRHPIGRLDRSQETGGSHGGPGIPGGCDPGADRSQWLARDHLAVGPSPSRAAAARLALSPQGVRCPARIRRTSRITAGWSWQRWPDDTSDSDATPSRWALSYGTRPSLPPAGGVAPVRDDGMGLDRRRQSELIQAHEDRRLPLQLVDAGGQALAEAFREEIGAIAGDEPLVRRPERVGEADEPRAEALQPAPVDATPAVRRGDEDHAADLRTGLEDQGAAEQVAIGLVARELLDGAIAEEPPQPGPAVLDHHLGQQAAHAVADEDHPVKGRILAVGVELSPHFIEVVTQQHGRMRDRVARRVAEGPELIAVAEGRIGLQVLDHPGPRPRARPQAVDEDHGDPPRR